MTTISSFYLNKCPRRDEVEADFYELFEILSNEGKRRNKGSDSLSKKLIFCPR